MPWHGSLVASTCLVLALPGLRIGTCSRFVNMRKEALKRILVVDDQPLVCESIGMLLAYDGHEVETSFDGDEALAKYDPSRFDLVFTDFSMPGMKGDQLALAIKEQEPARPVIMLTAFPPATVPPAIDLIVTKPFDLKTLRDALRKLLGA